MNIVSTTPKQVCLQERGRKKKGGWAGETVTGTAAQV